MKVEEGEGVNKFDKVQQRLPSREEDADDDWVRPKLIEVLGNAGRDAKCDIYGKPLL